MANTPGLYMCLGPRCGSGQIHESADTEPMMVCNACQFRTCVFHGLPWHEGQTCEEFDCDDSQIERLEADEATAKLLIASSQICPSCKQGVTKQDGCDHMQCKLFCATFPKEYQLITSHRPMWKPVVLRLWCSLGEYHTYRPHSSRCDMHVSSSKSALASRSTGCSFGTNEAAGAWSTSQRSS